jgi:hypothetical protein
MAGTLLDHLPDRSGSGLCSNQRPLLDHLPDRSSGLCSITCRLLARGNLELLRFAPGSVGHPVDPRRPVSMQPCLQLGAVRRDGGVVSVMPRFRHDRRPDVAGPNTRPARIGRGARPRRPDSAPGADAHGRDAVGLQRGVDARHQKLVAVPQQPGRLDREVGAGAGLAALAGLAAKAAAAEREVAVPHQVWGAADKK